MKALAALSAAALAVFAAAPATTSNAADAAAKPSMSTCFRTHDIQAHRFADDDTLYLRVGLHDIYRLEMSGRCLAGHMRDDPLVIDPAPPSGQACRPVDLSLKIGHQGGHMAPSGCIVRSMQKLTAAEAAALPPKVRP